MKARMMNRLLGVLVPAAFLTGLVTPAGAADWGPPTSAFSATVTVADASGRKLSMRLYHTPTRRRLDYRIGKHDRSLLVDDQRKVGWLIDRTAKTYRRLKDSRQQFFYGVSNGDPSVTLLGHEKMAGKKTDKYKVASTLLNGDRFTGFFWATSARIVVKMQGSLRHGKRTHSVTLSVSDLKIGPQKATLFVLPPNFKAATPVKK